MDGTQLGVIIFSAILGTVVVGGSLVASAVRSDQVSHPVADAWCEDCPPPSKQERYQYTQHNYDALFDNSKSNTSRATKTQIEPTIRVKSPEIRSYDNSSNSSAQQIYKTKGQANYVNNSSSNSSTVADSDQKSRSATPPGLLQNKKVRDLSPRLLDRHYYRETGHSFSEASFSDVLIRNAVGNLFRLTEGAFGALIMVIAGLASIVAASAGNYRTAVSLVVVAVGAFILRALVSLFFGEYYIASDSDAFSRTTSYAVSSPSIEISPAMIGSEENTSETLIEP